MKKEKGYALILSLIALSVMTLLGLTLAFNAMTDKRIANNYEAEILANQLAEAGINRALLELRGIAFTKTTVGGTTYTKVLIGPNGAQDTATATVNSNAFDFRNPLPVKGLKVVDPRVIDISNISQIITATRNDDGVVTAIGQAGAGYYVSPGPDGIFGTADDIGFFDHERAPAAQDQLAGRYVVKVTNNPEDPGGPFNDTDYILIIRSTGVAIAMRGETVISSTNIRNSVVTLETRIRLDTTFHTNSPFTVQGNSVAPAGNRFFDANPYSIHGGSFLGISVINTHQPPVTNPLDTMTNSVCGAAFSGNTTGAGLENGPPCDSAGHNSSVRNITGNILRRQTWGEVSNPDVTSVLNPTYLGNFIFSKVPSYADQIIDSDAGCEAFQGDINNPKLVYVCGNLRCSGANSGAGLLIVTGNYMTSGPLTFSGMILVIGRGSVDIRGNPRISGGVWTSKVSCLPGGACGMGSGVNCAFGQAAFTLRGNLGGANNTDYISMGLSLLPFRQLGTRKIQIEMEP